MIKKISLYIKNQLNKLSNLVLIILVVLFAMSILRNIVSYNKANLKIKEAKQSLEKLKNENANLQKRLTEVQSSDYIEKQIRDKLGMAKEGEVVIVLPDEEVLRKLAPKEVEEVETLPDPNWKKWLKLFL